MKVVKAAAQVLNTLWQYRDLRTIYKKVRGGGETAAATDLRMPGKLYHFKALSHLGIHFVPFQ